MPKTKESHFLFVRLQQNIILVISLSEMLQVLICALLQFDALMHRRTDSTSRRQPLISKYVLHFDCLFLIFFFFFIICLNDSPYLCLLITSDPALYKSLGEFTILCCKFKNSSPHMCWILLHVRTSLSVIKDSGKIIFPDEPLLQNRRLFFPQSPERVDPVRVPGAAEQKNRHERAASPISALPEC